MGVVSHVTQMIHNGIEVESCLTSVIASQTQVLAQIQLMRQLHWTPNFPEITNT